MDQTRNGYQVWWLYDQTITAPVNVIVPIGCNLLTGFNPAGDGIGLVRDLHYFHFTLTGTWTTATLKLKCEIGNAAATLYNWWTFAHTPTGTVRTVHDMPTPYNTSSGSIKLATTYLRLTLKVEGSGDVTNLLCMAKAWK